MIRLSTIALIVMTLRGIASSSLPIAGGGIREMASAARLLAAQSDTISGTYKIRNVGTGAYLTWDGSQSLYPGSSAAALQIYSNGNGIRISTPNDKCLSAQWGGDYDHAGVLYQCTVGPGAQNTGLVRAKQWWYLIPAISISDASSSKSHKKASHRHVKSRHHHHSAPRHKKHHHHKRATVPETPAALSKRGGGGTYYIVATDHITDMSTRALSGKAVNTGGETSTALASYTQGNELQMWTFVPS